MKFIIKGEKILDGVVKISGAKNAATPIIAATALTKEECILENIPKITDVEKMLKILESIGGEVKWISKNRLRIKNSQLRLKSLDKNLIKSMRSSILFLGSLLTRFDSLEIPEPGGCIIGNRPLNAHFWILRKMGVEIERKKDFYSFKKNQLKGTTIILPEFSVTATENALMLSSLARGKTVIKLAACEPHVQDLAKFLIKMGAKIKGIGTHTLEIEGVEELKGTRYKIIPDPIEIGTFIVAALVTKGRVKIENVIPEHLEAVLLKLEEIGADFKVGENYLEIFPSLKLKSFSLKTLPYPGFPTDLQAPFGLLGTQCEGTSLIYETMYDGRLNYINELVKMGASADILDPHRVLIKGPTPLYGKEIKSLDLRAGATLIIAGLIAKGETIINEAEIIDRGYERIDEKLKGLGAEIRRVE